MSHMPALRVVPLDSIRRHEEIDPLRVHRLEQRIESEGIQVNPMVCVEAPDGEIVLLDGATRTEALKGIGLSHAVVQLVDPDSVDLSTWHHVIRGDDPAAVISILRANPVIELSENYGTPSVHPNRGPSLLVTAAGDVSDNSALAALVSSYTGRWEVTRTTDPHREHVVAAYPGWAAVVEFPTLTVEDVMAAAVGDDLLPAGITRFLVPERALRLNVPLDILQGGPTTTEAQAALERILEQRASQGRVRRYEGPVFVLDD